MLAGDAPAHSPPAPVELPPRADQQSMILPQPALPQDREPQQLTPEPIRQSGREEPVFAADAQATLRAISGRVTDDHDQPVADCEVRIYKSNRLLQGINLSGTRQVLETRAVSAPDGSFRLAGVPVGRDYVLVGEHPAFATTELPGLEVSEHGDLRDVVLRLELGATISGVVTTSTGTPIYKARVELYDAIASVQLEPDDRRPWKIVFTADDGSYALEHVAATSLRLRVESPGFESQSRMLSFALEARASDRTVDFALKPGMSLPGRVVDERGRPIADVRVEATSLTKDYQGTALARSDNNGYFLLDGMSNEQYYQVRASAKGYSNKVLPKVHVDDRDCPIEMETRLGVEGWVFGSGDVPVTKFTLTLMRSAEGRDPLYLNDTRNFATKDGHFVFDNLDPGTYSLEATAKGFAPAWSDPFSLTRSDEPMPQVRFQLDAGGTLRGTVSDARGEPVKGATVRLNPNNHLDSPIQGIFAVLGGTTQPKIQTVTDGEGRFRLENLRPGVYQLACDHAGAAPFTLNDVIVPADGAASGEQRIVLPAGASIAGRAFDNHQLGIPFCEIQINNKETAFLDAATTDAEGRFKFSNLAEGSYTLMIKPDRISGKPINPLMKLMYAQKSQLDIFISSGQAVDGIELFLPDLEQ